MSDGTPDPNEGGQDQGQASQQRNAPWSSDLEQRFPDPDVRASVDAYLREVQQPRMTQLEQQARASQDAQQLYDAFREDPNGAYLSITEQLYGEQQAQDVVRALNGEYGQQAQQQAQQQVQDATQQAQQQVQAPETPQAPQMSDEDRQLLEQVRQERALAQYDRSVNQAIDQAGFTKAQADHARANIHDFVVGADGDIDAGLQRYRNAFEGMQWTADGTESESDQAPSVMDGEGGRGDNPRVAPKRTWDQAFEDFKNEDLRVGQPPPPVGAA